MATHTLATWAVSTTAATVPDKVQYQALRSIYNYLGCAIYGSVHPTVHRAHAAFSPFFGPPRSTLLGWRGHGSRDSRSKSTPAVIEGGAKAVGGRDAPSRDVPNPKCTTDAQHAALLNGIAAHVHDYDDTHLETVIHPTAAVAAALLAYIESSNHRISGEEFLVALVVGIEAECKLGISVSPEHYNIGWHITSSVGSIGAAVAVGKVMGLDVTGMENAIGIASTQVTGLREMFGSDTKAFHVGRAAQNGLVAALLAEQRFTSSVQALEAKRGWANVVAGGGKPQLNEVFQGLGKTWETEKNSFKPFPCGIVCHPVIDACIQVHCELKARAEAQDSSVETFLGTLKKAQARVHPLVLELTAKRKPKDGLDAKFSVFHGGAVGLLFGKAGVKEYADGVVRDAAVVSIRDKIDVTADPEVNSDETIVTLAFETGEEMCRHVERSLAVPVTDAQLKEKFVDQVSEVLGIDEAQKVSELCWGLSTADDVASIIAVL